MPKDIRKLLLKSASENDLSSIERAENQPQGSSRAQAGSTSRPTLFRESLSYRKDIDILQQKAMLENESRLTRAWHNEQMQKIMTLSGNDFKKALHLLFHEAILHSTKKEPEQSWKVKLTDFADEVMVFNKKEIFETVLGDINFVYTNFTPLKAQKCLHELDLWGPNLFPRIANIMLKKMIRTPTNETGMFKSGEILPSHETPAPSGQPKM